MIAVRPGPDRRVFAVLAALLLIAPVLSMPYEDVLVAQGPAAQTFKSPFARLAVQLVLAVLVTLPLCALGLRLGARFGLGAPLLERAFHGTLAPGEVRRGSEAAGASALGGRARLVRRGHHR